MEFEVSNSKLDLFFTVLQKVKSQNIIPVRLLASLQLLGMLGFLYKSFNVST